MNEIIKSPESKTVVEGLTFVEDVSESDRTFSEKSTSGEPFGLEVGFENDHIHAKLYPLYKGARRILKDPEETTAEELAKIADIIRAHGRVAE